MASTSTPNFRRGSSVARALAPNRNTTRVCSSMNRLSKPITPGVRMRLLVTVWKITAAKAVA